MTRIAILGNCQSGPIQSMVKAFCPGVTLVEMMPVHLMKPVDQEAAATRCARADVIIHQPLGKSFGPITSQVLRAALPDKTFVSFPSIYFGGLFPQLTYLRQPGGPVLLGPVNDYHDARIIASYLAGDSPEACLQRLQEDDSGMLSYYERAYEHSVKTEQDCDVKAMDVLMDGIAAAPPLYTFNHPNNAVLWTMIERTFRHAGLLVPARPELPSREFLSNTRAAIPDIIPRHLGAAWRRPEYSLWEDVKPMPGLVHDYYQLYDDQSDFVALCRHNAHRFNVEVAIPD